MENVTLVVSHIDLRQILEVWQTHRNYTFFLVRLQPFLETEFVQLYNFDKKDHIML